MTKRKADSQRNGQAAAPLLKFNYVKREPLTQCSIDARALHMVRSYPHFVEERTGHEKPKIGEVLEQCIINTLSQDAEFVKWLELHQMDVTGDVEMDQPGMLNQV